MIKNSIGASKLLFLVCSFIFITQAAPALAATYYVDPSAATNGTGTLASPYNTWASVVFHANNSYFQKGGTTFNGSIYIGNVTSSSTSPLVIGAYGTGAPVIQGSLSLDNDSYVIVSGMTFTNSSLAAVAIMNGSSHITVQNNTMSHDASGVWIGNSPGMNNAILNNTITYSSAAGIAVSDGSCTPGNETYISGNTVANGATHGIDIQGNYYIVQSNIVHDSGTSVSGSSGLHTLGSGVAGAQGSNNIFRNNISYKTHETAAYDGNGIELDRFSSNNQVYNNLFFGNDGAGAIAFDSSNDTFSNNTILNNIIDTSGTHVAQYKGEFVLGAGTNPPVVNLTTGTNAQSNTLLSTKSAIPSILVDSLTSGNPQTIGSNSLYNTAAGNSYSWAGTAGSNMTTWNSTYTPGGGDDQNTSVTVTNGSGVSTSSMDFAFGTADQLIVSLNGSQMKLVGWSAATGLYADYRVKTTQSVSVRATPSTTGTLLGTQKTGAVGTVTNAATGSGFTWWYVQFDAGVSGWVRTDFLVGIASAQTKSRFTQSANVTTEITHTLAKSWTGPEVSTLQNILQTLGYFSQSITGYFGPVTEAAVIGFQKAHALEPVGIVGPQTRALLNAQQ